MNCLKGLSQQYRDSEPSSLAGSVSSARLGLALRTLAEAEVLCQDAAMFQLEITADVLLNNRTYYADRIPQPFHCTD